MAVARQYQQPRRIILGDVLPGPGEPLWHDDDREWAIAYETWLAELCRECGTPRHVWNGAKDGELPFVGVVTSCRGCEEVADTEEEIPEGERKPWRRVVMVPGDMYDRQQEIAEADEQLGEQRRHIADAAERLGLPRPGALARSVVG
jgi:hypothetical protein